MRSMTSSIRVELGPVQETLLIPLLARARETERPRGLLRDPRAIEIMRDLNYDFSKWEGGRGPDGVSAVAGGTGAGPDAAPDGGWARAATSSSPSP